MKENNKQRPDVYQMVTDRIIASLEKGVVPWKKPWRDAGPPRNLITGKVYRGINFWLLNTGEYSHNLFLSYKQIQELRGKVKQGEKSHIIVFWKQVELDDPESVEKKKIPFLRYYQVYNIAQCEGLPETKVPSEGSALTEIRPCEDIVNEMPMKPIIQHKGERAYYNPLKDFINMPPKGQFTSIEGYYGTLFHELVHSSGHSKRLNRKELLQMAEFGSDLYSQEELTAEIGASFLQSIANIDGKEEQDNKAAYIKGWLSKLKDDKKFIIYASTQAQKAVDFILNVQFQQPEESVENSIHESEEVAD